MIKTQIICDKCGDGYEIVGTVNMAYITAIYRKKRGWSLGKKHLCPNCKTKKEKTND